jgi:hypothetical protein
MKNYEDDGRKERKSIRESSHCVICIADSPFAGCHNVGCLGSVFYFTSLAISRKLFFALRRNVRWQERSNDDTTVFICFDWEIRLVCAVDCDMHKSDC